MADVSKDILQLRLTRLGSTGTIANGKVRGALVINFGRHGHNLQKQRPCHHGLVKWYTMLQLSTKSRQ